MARKICSIDQPGKAKKVLIFCTQTSIQCLFLVRTVVGLLQSSSQFLQMHDACKDCDSANYCPCSYLGELLRALLVLEVRQLTVVSQKPTQRIPAHLPSSSTAVCCHIQTACKAEAQVVLGGPPQGEGMPRASLA